MLAKWVRCVLHLVKGQLTLSRPVDLPISTGRSFNLDRRSPYLDRSIPGLTRRSPELDRSIPRWRPVDPWFDPSIPGLELSR